MQVSADSRWPAATPDSTLPEGSQELRKGSRGGIAYGKQSGFQALAFKVDSDHTNATHSLGTTLFFGYGCNLPSPCHVSGWCTISEMELSSF